MTERHASSDATPTQETSACENIEARLRLLIASTIHCPSGDTCELSYDDQSKEISR